MTIRVVRLGTDRAPGEGVRLGTVRRPPRGVKKEDYARLDFYDVWFPELAPSAKLLQSVHAEPGMTDAKWKRFAAAYRREMSQPAASRTIEATEPAMTGIIFKIQANMDPNHRDRMAFMRLCSGRLTRGMKVKHVRTDKTMALTAPQFFFAQDRSLAEEAFAGDVVGIPNRGTLRIGDALTEGENVQFLGIPSFAPEILRRIRLEDAIRAKKLKDALREMAEEGVVQLFSPLDGTQPIVGVIGALQLDVLGDRLTHEYGLSTGFEPAPCEVMRWIAADDKTKLTRFIEANRSSIAVLQEDLGKPAAEILCDLVKIHPASGSCGTFNRKGVAVIRVVLEQSADDQAVDRHPDWASPVGVAAKHTAVGFGRKI